MSAQTALTANVACGACGASGASAGVEWLVGAIPIVVIDDVAVVGEHLRVLDYAQVFVEDVTFDRGDGQAPLHGITGIVATFKGRNAYAHHTTNVVITEVDDDTAHVHSKLLCFPNEGSPFTGDYYDTLTRTHHGWRIVHRRAELRRRKFFD